MNQSLILLLFYLALQFLICYWVSKKINSEDDFLLAGRSLGTPLITLSLFATWFGAETCIGSSSEVFIHGLSGSRADPFGYSLCLVLSGLFIATRIWNKKYTTLADLYSDRFGKKTEHLAVWILSLSSLIWAAAQLRAFGHVLSSATDLPVDLTLFLSFIFIVGYVFFGGLLGDIITDSIQALIISLGLIALFYFVFKENNFYDLLSQLAPERLTLKSVDESFMQRADRWAIPILGSLVAQEVISRLLAAKNMKISKNSCFYAAGIYIFMGSIPVLLGLIGPQIMSSSQANGEQFIINLAQTYLPTFFLPIFIGAIISALLATIDSILISVSGLISHNILIPYFNVKSEKKKIGLTRLVIVGSGSVAYILAAYSESIYSLLESASSFGTSGILIITLAGLWFNKKSDLVALGTLIVGLVSTPIYDFIFRLDSPFIASILTCLIFYIGCSFFDKKLMVLGQSTNKI